MYEILNNGNVVFLEIFHFPKDSHLCWKFRRLSGLSFWRGHYVEQYAYGGLMECFWAGIFWRKTCHSAFYLPQIPHRLVRYWIRFSVYWCRRL